MKNIKRIGFLLVLAMIFSAATQQVYAEKTYVIGEHMAPVTKPDPASTYVGSEKCKICHSDKYNDWRTSGHPYKLNTPAEAQAFNSPAIPAPEGYTYNDFYLVIGGWTWKARFLDNNGYIITKTGPGKDINGSNQYLLATKKWADYSAGQTKKFDCGNCHTTGYSLTGSQDNKPGIVGTWEEKSVGCEACHGPGSVHVAKGGGKGVGILKNDSAALCGACHTRGADDTKIMSKDGFIEHHEQYPEFLNSPHKELSCVSCHDPHKGTRVGQTNPTAGASIKAQCSTCHPKQNNDFTGSTMQKAGIKCTDCHMPAAGKSAVGDAASFKGDVKTHIFKINTDINAKFFDDTGKFANGYVTLDRACLNCHNDKDKAWAGQYAKGIHKFVKAETTATQSETPVSTSVSTQKAPGFELLFAIGALLIVALARRR
ncbi:doubled CXXCH motif-containing protein [Candidatus Methanoperedens nitroreducens]|uniref:Doubled CXXCH motif-containing protein n=1 Tax=Candidatus Methanoperedens nitratireducens TaxID=1392998 RepID=A0A062V6X9_9EURY|nr:multiheme c-type cytochrome [Candidatus Methanoperedens nitroreducens]KCZ73062.1 doubled CXXCH motif-containing protein [Candidatus Methanoperedens nitroreducens]MDJ1422992.1 cytochrome c3 family protein [Candidatus Methanoperedens sp.]